MTLKDNKTKTTTAIMASLIIGLMMLSPLTVLPSVGAQQDNNNPEIINHINAPAYTPPNVAAQEADIGKHPVLPPGPIRDSKDAPVHDVNVCSGPPGGRSDQVKCVIVPGFGSVNTWAEGVVFDPTTSGYSTFTGIGAAPQLISLGGTSFSTPVTYEVVTLNIVDSSGHKWGLQNTLGWGYNSDCGTSGYAQSIWLYDVTGGTNYWHTHWCISGSIVGNQYNLTIYYDSATSQWKFRTYDGVIHSITEIPGIPSSTLSAVDSTTTAANGQEPILLESADTTATDFNNFEIDMYGSEIRTTGGSWVLAGSGCCTVNIPAYSYYGNAAIYASYLNIVGYVGGNLVAPTTVGYAGHTEYVQGYIPLNLGPGISFSKSGYPNYWICPLCGNPPPQKVQATSPGSGWGPYAGYSLW